MDPNQGQKKDFVDKAVDKLETKRGMDPNANRSMNESVTDKARGMLEKATGKHVPDKVSN